MLANSLHVRFKKNLPNAQIPSRGSPGAAAYDLHAANIVLDEATGHVIVDTGLSTAFSPSHVMLIFGRSGLAMKHGIRLANSVAVIDSDYRGPIKILLRSDIMSPLQLMQTIKPGDRIAQCMFVETNNACFFEVTDLDITDRNEGGFGSTGTS